ncbi:MAG: hypothetical protein ACR2PG_03110 [Hyphomicrobiaceae bacterium]
MSLKEYRVSAWPALILLAFVAIALVGGGWSASAHLWYPKYCCNDQDCFRALSVRQLPDGSLRIKSGHVTVIVPKGYPSLASRDNDFHVCVYRDIRGRYQPRCVFFPGIG